MPATPASQASARFTEAMVSRSAARPGDASVARPAVGDSERQAMPRGRGTALNALRSTEVGDTARTVLCPPPVRVSISYRALCFLPLHARAIPSSCLPVRPPKTEGRRKGNP
jgi:hypothetical protein